MYYFMTIDFDFITYHNLFLYTFYYFRETIIKGAQESQLPDSYIQFLKMISHNGFKGKCEIR